MNSQILGIIAALLAVIFVLALLRKGILPERFAALWIVVSVGLLVLALFPQISEWIARVTGVQVPLNLLLFGAAVVLLLVSVQLSFEVGRLEARTRRLAEEIAILAEKLDGLASRAEPMRAGSEESGGGQGLEPLAGGDAEESSADQQ